MSTYSQLAIERINILGLEVLPRSGSILTHFEYQWEDAQGNRQWSKACITVDGKSDPNLEVLKIVKEIRAELEQG